MLTTKQYQQRKALVSRIVWVLAYAFAIAVVFMDVVVWRP